MHKSFSRYMVAGLAAALLLLPGCNQNPHASDSSASDAPVFASGWAQKDGNTFYMNAAGSPITGWLDIGGKLYYLDPNRDGAMATGWFTVDEKEYFFQEDGVMLTGWVESAQGKRYFLANGTPVKGWLEWEGDRYYFGNDGFMVTGWLKDSGNTYYLRQNGRAAKGRVVIDGDSHFFTATGAEILLVNPWNSVPEGYQVDLTLFQDVADGYIATVCYDALLQMWNDCEAAGHKLSYCSGYRTQETQALYFKSWCNYLVSTGMTQAEAFEATKKEVAYPGTSEHQLGLAVDLTDYYYKTLDEKQSQTATQQWLMEHCWDYGFILRYPAGTTTSTGIIYEPWHYRYVGLELAQELKELGITLEEYLENLTET